MSLNEAQLERLDLLIEECSEVIQAACKIKRFGYESTYPILLGDPNNREHLEIEVGGLCAVLDLFALAGDIDEDHCEAAQNTKAGDFNLNKYTNYQANIGESCQLTS